MSDKTRHAKTNRGDFSQGVPTWSHWATVPLPVAVAVAELEVMVTVDNVVAGAVVVGVGSDPELARSETIASRYPGYPGLAYSWLISHNMTPPKLEKVWL